MHLLLNQIKTIWFFRLYQKYSDPRHMYTEIIVYFTRLLKSLKLDDRYDDGRHKMTLHRFRDFVKSTISNQGYSDFSEYMIGHVHSTYFSVPDDEKVKVFKKIEASITFLDKDAVGAIAKDLQSQINAEGTEIEKLKKRLAKTEKAMESMLRVSHAVVNPVVTRENRKLLEKLIDAQGEK